MKLIFDTDTSQLIVAEGFASPVALLEAKRGTGAKIQLTLLRDGQALDGSSFVAVPVHRETVGQIQC